MLLARISVHRRNEECKEWRNDEKKEIPCRSPEQKLFRAGSTE
jgi:hypothetical protein